MWWSTVRSLTMPSYQPVSLLWKPSPQKFHPTNFFKAFKRSQLRRLISAGRGIVWFGHLSAHYVLRKRIFETLNPSCWIKKSVKKKASSSVVWFLHQISFKFKFAGPNKTKGALRPLSVVSCSSLNPQCRQYRYTSPLELFHFSFQMIWDSPQHFRVSWFSTVDDVQWLFESQVLVVNQKQSTLVPFVIPVKFHDLNTFWCIRRPWLVSTVLFALPS